jgi:hypothetical protein
MRQCVLWYQRCSAYLAVLVVANIWGVGFVFRKATLAESDVAVFNLLQGPVRAGSDYDFCQRV